MLTLTDVAHGHQLASAPAAAYARARAAGAPAGITSSFRSRERQAELRRLYLAGRGAFALPPGQSEHEKGYALDLPEPARSWSRWPEFGWVRSNPDEPWHREYRASADKHRNEPPPTIPAPVPDLQLEDDDMAVMLRTPTSGPGVAPEGAGAIFLVRPDKPMRHLTPEQYELVRHIKTIPTVGDYSRAEVDILNRLIGSGE